MNAMISTNLHLDRSFDVWPRAFRAGAQCYGNVLCPSISNDHDVDLLSAWLMKSSDSSAELLTPFID